MNPIVWTIIIGCFSGLLGLVGTLIAFGFRATLTGVQESVAGVKADVARVEREHGERLDQKRDWIEALRAVAQKLTVDVATQHERHHASEVSLNALTGQLAQLAVAIQTQAVTLSSIATKLDQVLKTCEQRTEKGCAT